MASATYSQTTFTVDISEDWADVGNWSNRLSAAGNDAAIPAAMTVVNSTLLTTDFDITYNGINYNNEGTIAHCGTW